MASETVIEKLQALGGFAAAKSHDFAERMERLAESAESVADQADALAAQASVLVTQAAPASGGTSFVMLFTVFVLAVFVGYYVVWNVTPALHSPLMGVTNAISSVIIVGALIAAAPPEWNFSRIFGVIAVILASVNIFGGFIVTQRMLSMFKKKK